MATFRKPKDRKGNTNYQAYIRKRGFVLSRVFKKAHDAREWATKVEAAIDLHSPVSPFDRDKWMGGRERKATEAAEYFGDSADLPNVNWTMARALEVYGQTVSPRKASPGQEATRIKHLTATLGHIKMSALRLRDVQRHVDARLAAGRGAATVRLEVMQLRALWKHARAAPPHGWGLDLGVEHPCKGVVLPPEAPGRDRRLQDEDQEHGQQAEEQALRAALAAVAGTPEEGAELVDIYNLMLATGMRRGEALGIHRGEVRREGRITVIAKAKHKTARHGTVRRIVLSSAALEIVRRRLASTDPANPLERIWTIGADRLAHRWRQARKKAGCQDVRLHDLRHEALSRMADAGLTVGELKAQGGWKTTAMLGRYINARAKDIAAKLG